MQRRRNRITEVLITACERPRSAKILSLGCGNGETEITAAPHFGHITGLDLSELAIEQASERASAAGASNTNFITGDCTELEGLGLDTPFDAVWALGFLHHISDDEMRKLVRGVYKVLAPGGVMVTLDPSSRRLVGLLKSLVPGKIEKHHSPDERELDPRWLQDMFSNAGYSDIGVSYVDFFVGPFSWVFPKHGSGVASLLWPVDRALCSMPVVKNFSSGFQVVAKRP